MTVCIAAMANHRKQLILVADQMITARIPIPFEYETEDVRKIYKLSDSVYAMTAGDALNSYRIIDLVQREIHSKYKPTPDRPLPIDTAVEMVRAQYQNVRRMVAVRKHLEPRGFDLESYYNSQHKLSQRIIGDIDEALTDYDINVEFIVAGFDGDKECHIYTITHPGYVTMNDAVGYASVGSGAPHATYSLIAADYSKDLTIDEVKRMVMEAKKASEKAPGVGKHTTMEILDAEEETTRNNKRPRQK